MKQKSLTAFTIISLLAAVVTIYLLAANIVEWQPEPRYVPDYTEEAAPLQTNIYLEGARLTIHEITNQTVRFAVYNETQYSIELEHAPLNRIEYFDGTVWRSARFISNRMFTADQPIFPPSTIFTGTLQREEFIITESTGLYRIRVEVWLSGNTHLRHDLIAEFYWVQDVCDQYAILQTLSPIAIDYYVPLSDIAMEVTDVGMLVVGGPWGEDGEEYIILQYRITNNSPHYIRAGWPVFIEGYHCGVWLNWPIGATSYRPFVIIPPGDHHDFAFSFIPQLNIQPLNFRIVKRVHYVSDPSRFTPHLPSHHLTAEFTLD